MAVVQATDTPMLRQYREIKAQAEDAILFFRLGDFYEMFLTDAEVASGELDLTLTGRGKDENRIPMCGIPYHAAESYIQKLVSRGYKVAICEQVEEATGKGLTRREIVRVVTPGTVFGHGALDEKSNNYLVSVCLVNPMKNADVLGAANESLLNYGDPKGASPLKNADVLGAAEHMRYGVSFLDISTGEYRMGSFSEIDLLSLLDRLGAREILLDAMVTLPGKWTMLQNKVDMLRWREAQSRLSAHFGEHVFSGMGLQSVASALPAAWALLHYVMTTQKASLPHITRLRIFGMQDHLFMDRVTVQNLELIQSRTDAGKKGTLFGILDDTCTAMGARKLKQLIQYPLVDPARIEMRLDAVDVLVYDRLSREEIREILGNVYDLERLVGRIVAHYQQPRDLLSLKQTLTALSSLPSVLAHLTGELFLRYQGLFARFAAPGNPYYGVIALITDAIVDPAPANLRDGGVIRPGFHVDLDALTQSFQDIRMWIQGLEIAERERTGIKSLKVGYTRVFGYYIEVPNAQLEKVPIDYIRKQTLTHAERFITPELKEKETLLLHGEEQQQQLEVTIYGQVVDHIVSVVSDLQTLAAAVAELDCLQALATVSTRYGYTRPTFVSTRGSLKLYGSRHPILERDREKPFIPNDILMDENSRFLLITGPNMAGKSTLMRQVALTVIMAQMGCFVPADKAELYPVDKLFTRIGALDNLYFGQSTFMVEMVETAAILNHASIDSLIVLDEVGRGTSTFDGMSLACAISTHLYSQTQARSMFATHYHELTALESRFQSLRNFSMQIQETGDDIVFTHRFVPGPADKSYGIHVAKMAGLPAGIIADATALLNGFEAEGVHYLREQWETHADH